jgi:hypothetical protein
MDGWIKLHRKSLDNKLFKDVTAWHIFEFCLLMADKNTGEMSMGRNQWEDWTGVKGTTAYGALKRLKKHKMVTLTVTFGKYGFTTVRIINWNKYQESMTVTLTKDCPKTDTLQEDNIYIITDKNLETLKNKYNLNFDEEIERWKDYHNEKGTKIKNYDGSFRTWCKQAIEFGRGKLKNKTEFKEFMIGGEL